MENDIIKSKMSEQKEMSLFDGELSGVQVTRSEVRRKAVFIPAKKGKEFLAMIQKEMEKEKEAPRQEDQEELHQA